jgi:hypothetical protein
MRRVKRYDNGTPELYFMEFWTSSMVTVSGTLVEALRPRVGHALLAAPEVHETRPQMDRGRRAARDARVPATIDVIALAVRRRHDVVGRNLSTPSWRGEVTDRTTSFINLRPCNLRTCMGCCWGDSRVGALEQPCCPRHNGQRGNEHLPPRPPRRDPRLLRRSNGIGPWGDDIDDCVGARCRTNPRG